MATTVKEEGAETVATTAKPSIKEVLTNKPYMMLFSAQFIENVGRAISGLALEFLIYELTRSPLMMGILSIIWLSPFVVIAPIAGVYTDRFDQRKIMLWSNVASFLASIGFIVIYLLKGFLTVITHVKIAPGQNLAVINYTHVIWPLFILCFINSASAAFFFPARNAYTRLIIKKKNLLVANSIGSTIFQIATIFGFVLAGVLAATSYLASFITNAATFLVSGTLILFLFKIGQKPPEVIREKAHTMKEELQSFFADVKIGYRTIKESPKISYMLLIFSSITFTFGAVNVLFIVILQGEMALGATWYGILQGLMGAAGIITAITLMLIGKIKRKVLMINIAFAMATVALYLFSVTRNKWVMAGILFSFGIISVSINIPASTLIQETVAYEKQGRVFGAQQLAQGISQLLGMGIVSLIAEYVLPMYVLLASSTLCTIIIIAGFIYSGSKKLMGSDYGEEETVKPKTKAILPEEDEMFAIIEKKKAEQQTLEQGSVVIE